MENIRQKKLDEFKKEFSEHLTTKQIGRSLRETKGTITRNYGKACTQDDVDFLKSFYSLGQVTKFELVDGAIQVYGMVDSGD